MEEAGKCDDPNAIHRWNIFKSEVIEKPNYYKNKKEHISKVNIPNIAYPGQHIDIDILHGSRDHIILPGTIKITFNLDLESTDKARSVVNDVGRALVKKKVLMLGSTDIDMINNSDIYDTYKDLYLSEK